MSTLIDKWMEQGREQGLEQGRIEDRRNSIVDILAARFHDVPESIRDTVHRISDSQRLVRLTSIAATCESIDQFAESLT